jgi:hypothetical protein
MVQLDVHTYDSRPNDDLPQKDRDDVASGEVGAVGWEDSVAVGASVGGEVARALPADELDAGADSVGCEMRREYTSQAGFAGSVFGQRGLREMGRVRACPAERSKQRLDEAVEGHLR